MKETLRLNLLFIGLLILAAGLLLLSSYPLPYGLFTTPLGVVNLGIGATTGKSSGISSTDGLDKRVRLTVDKAILGASVYRLVFLETRLVMKRLASPWITLALVLLLAVAGLFLDGVLGGLAGGLTGYSAQEFVTQKRRDKIAKSGSWAVMGSNDLEFLYESLVKVQIRGNRILLFTASSVRRINMPRGYGNKIRPALESIIPQIYDPSPSLVADKSPQKKGQ